MTSHWRRPTGAGDGAAAVREEGSALIEAVLGLSLLVMVVAAASSLHRAAVETFARGEQHSASIRAAELHLERSFVLDPDVDDGVSGTSVEGAISVDRVDGGARGICMATPHDSQPLTDVTVRGEAGDTPDVILRGRGRASSEGGLRVRLPSASLPASLEVVITSGDGMQWTAESDGSGCFEFRGVPSGSYVIDLRSDGPPLVDRTHVPLDERPVPVTLLDAEVALALDVAPAALLRVSADADGARPPDVVHPGTLGWSVRHDDQRRVTPIGSTRPVHPGRVEAVVSACANPDAVGSRATIELVPGQDADLSIRLVTLVVDGIGTDDDAVLDLVLVDACTDGTGVRPSLRWMGGLGDGMRIALPAGVWAGRLVSATGAGLTGAVRIEAASSDARVVLR